MSREPIQGEVEQTPHERAMACLYALNAWFCRKAAKVAKKKGKPRVRKVSRRSYK
jgi:hypothetical protein